MLDGGELMQVAAPGADGVLRRRHGG